jgi:hypothetical protein
MTGENLLTELAKTVSTSKEEKKEERKGEKNRPGIASSMREKDQEDNNTIGTR